ncbi:SET domain-containing protein [Pseudozyma hubeiensis]|nr:SET domain-containing protein [Pseudozyma hubeiensis]
MIKPPAMGVFARDPPPAGRGGAPSSSSSAQSQSLPTDFSPANHLPSASSTIPTDQTPSDPAIPDDEAAQDDDDQGTVDEEAGVIRCICGCDDDDGFTIQCDRCLVWQHCACFGMSQASVPDEYLCEQCEPRPVDVAFAQAHQQKRKNNEARKALMDRNLKRQQQALASATTYNQPHLSQDTVSSPTSAALPLPTQESLPTHQQSVNHAPSPAAAARARKPSQALDLTNTQFVVPEIPASAGTAQRGAKQRKGHKGSRRGHDTPSAVSTPVRGVYTPGSSHDRADDPFDLADQLEAWHIEFTPISKNVVADPSVLESLALAMLDWEDGSPLKAVPGPAGRVLAPIAPKSSTSAKLSHLESLAPSSSTSSPSSSSPRALASPAPESEPIGIAAVGQECVPVELTGSCLADLACRTYVRHISESASAGVFSNLLYVNNSADEPQRSWSASRAFSRPVMHGLFADASIPAGAFISELRGELYVADAYRNDPINQYAALGATKPHVHLLPPPLNLVIDARRFGNEARFARYSCHPNAVLRPILFYPNGQPPARSRTASRAQSPASALASSARNNRYADTPPAEFRSDEPQLLFGLFALTDISRTHEITVGWEWDDAHIVHFLPELVQNPYLESHGDDVDADQHTAHMVALAEKGEFPYADTEFSVKMSTVAAALLGSVLCACIGSAAPPGGGGGASSNNGRKQDCAVAQMLRVGNGMSLLNVTMPGKTNRRAKLPDFSPLVGIRRHWRPISLPPTPDTSVKDAASPVDQALLAALAAEGESRTVKPLDEAAIHAEAGCGGNEAAASRRKSRKAGRSKQRRISMAGDDHKSNSAASDLDDHADDSRSIASSLTDPLSGLSDNDLLSDDDDQDLIDAVRVADGLQPLRRSAKGSDAVDAELSGLFLLPPKKRSMRTRIKAVMAPSDDDGASDGDVQGDEDASTQVKALKGRRSADSVSKSKSITKRKSKLDAGRAPIDFSSDEDERFDASSAITPAKRRRKAGQVVDPSSPLSSVPSPNSVDSMTSPPPAASRGSVQRRLESERRMSDVELAKKRRAAKRGAGRNNESSKSRPKESASKRRKREEARIHRNAILDLGDTDSSEEGPSEDRSDDDKQRFDDDDGDTTMADVESRASTPRASNKGSDSRARDAAPPGEDAQLATDAVPHKTSKQDKTAVLPTSEDRKPALKDSVAKTKKVRRILSDSEASSDEKEIQAAGSTPKMAEQNPSRLDTAEKLAEGEPMDTEAVAKPKIEDDAASAETSSATQAPAPTPEVKKEEPRVKLSLAEYKRRLAERRVSGQQNAASSATPLTPTIATPTSEVGPSPSPALERSEPVLTLPTRSSEPTLTTMAAETVSTPTSQVTPSVADAPDAVETSKASASMSRGMLFTSISAPTAIRSVEIPKSPSPEPATTPSSQHQQGGAAPTSLAKDTVVALTQGSDTGAVVESAANSSVAGPASSPAFHTSALPAVGSSADTSALLMRLETRHNRAASAASAGEKDAQQGGFTSSAATEADADGFVRPLTVSANQATTPTAATFGSSAPLRSPSLGPTRTHAQAGGRLPPSPSGSSTFNPPKAPRAFMSPPGNNLPSSSILPVSSGAASSTSTSAPSPSSVSASGPGSVAAAATPSASSVVASTPARVGHAGGAVGVGNTPSTRSSAGSAAPPRYPAHGLTSPTPISTALPASSPGGYPPRNYAGVPKGPASMRDTDPRAEAWAEAREARGDYPLRHYDATRDGAARDMGWGERSRDPSGGMGEREGVRGGWGRERRDLAHSRPGYRRDDPAYGRDDLSSGGGEIGGGGGDHSHYAPYRRPSATEYDDGVREGVAGGAPVSPYDRPSDPYNRGIGIRGRSLGLGGPASNGPGMNSSAALPPTAGPPRDTARGEYRDYDDVGAGPGSGPQGHSHPRGGFRNGGGWGGRGRPRGRGHPDAGRGRGGWMR